MTGDTSEEPRPAFVGAKYYRCATGKGEPAMTDPKIAEFQEMFDDLLKRFDHPDIAEVETTDAAVRAKLVDGSKFAVRVAHIQPAGRPIPPKPTWPAYAGAAVSGGSR